MQPEQEHLQSCPDFPNIQFHWISQINAVFHTAEKKSG